MYKTMLELHAAMVQTSWLLEKLLLMQIDTMRVGEHTAYDESDLKQLDRNIAKADILLFNLHEQNNRCLTIQAENETKELPKIRK